MHMTQPSKVRQRLVVESAVAKVQASQTAEALDCARKPHAHLQSKQFSGLLVAISDCHAGHAERFVLEV